MAIAAIVLSYLLGSVSFAVVTSRMMGLPDPRTFGSKNPGATNVLRSGRKLAAALTLAGDGAKGWLAVFIAERFFADSGSAPYVLALSAVAVVIGHMYPVFHRFQGGKGVATAWGALLALNPWIAAGCLASWIIIAFFFRISSLASLAAALCAPFLAFLLYGIHPYTAGVALIAVLIIWRHKTNIKNLRAGTEGRIRPSIET